VKFLGWLQSRGEGLGRTNLCNFGAQYNPSSQLKFFFWLTSRRLDGRSCGKRIVDRLVRQLLHSSGSDSPGSFPKFYRSGFLKDGLKLYAIMGNSAR